MIRYALIFNLIIIFTDMHTKFQDDMQTLGSDMQTITIQFIFILFFKFIFKKFIKKKISISSNRMQPEEELAEIKKQMRSKSKNVHIYPLKFACFLRTCCCHYEPIDNKNERVYNVFIIICIMKLEEKFSVSLFCCWAELSSLFSLVREKKFVHLKNITYFFLILFSC